MKNLAFNPTRLKKLMLVGALTIFILISAHYVWKPGLDVTDGSHDKQQNALWLQHGWIGADSWFAKYHREAKKPLFRSDKSIHALNARCEKNHIRDVYPHLCPTQSDGSIMAVDDAQLERFLSLTPHLRTLPWIGGLLNSSVTPNIEHRNRKFMASVALLFKKHPRLAGVHLDVEPWPPGNKSMLHFLDELRVALPRGKILSVAAFPPPSRLNPYVDWQWDRDYFRAVAARCDQMAIMSYDTSLKDPKLFQWLVSRWSQGVLEWTKDSKTQILFGIATYNSDSSAHHISEVENMETALLGIHRALSHFSTLPANYQGVAIYCEWETDEVEWDYWRHHFTNTQ